ncbi:MAG: hypothetical protein AB8I69_18980 [Anaerolineae bacterium]|jgi:hypothetical protein
MRVSMVNSVVCGLALARVPGLLLKYQDLIEERPASSGWWVFGIVTIFILAIAVSLCVFLGQAQRSKCRQVCSVEISNEGNERDSYELQVEDPSGALEFTFVLHGAKLPQRNVTAPPANVPTESVSDARPPAGSKAARQSDTNSGGVTGIKRLVMGLASTAVALLTAVGSLLPTSIRAPVLQFASKIRTGQTSVRRVEQAPQRIARAARVSKPASSPSGSKRPAKGAVVEDAGGYAEPETFGVVTNLHTWARTPAVEPGSLLSVDLFIDPINPYQPGINLYPFVVKSRSVQQPEGTLVIEEGEAHVTGMTRIQRYGPTLIVFASAIVVISIIAVLAF